MGEQINVDEYWLARAKSDAEHERRHADYDRLQERFLLDILRDGELPMGKVLELGWGSSRIANLLLERYPAGHVTSLHPGPDQLDSAKRLGSGAANVRFEQCDFVSGAAFPESDYDTAIAVEVLLHYPRNTVRALVERLSAVSRHIVNLDWSEAWPWKRPEHVWIHDYQAVYAEAGLNCAAFLLPEKIEGMQQKLFVASRRMTAQMIRLKGMAEELQSAAEASLASVGKWDERLQQAMAEVMEIVPEGGSLILVNDDQWGSESELTGRRVFPFLEHDGRYWGPPDSDRTAIQELERLRDAGAAYMIFAWSSFWWLDYYTGLKKHLQTTFPCVLANERLVVFDLRS